MIDNFDTILNNIQPETPPLWGKMTVHHMLEHLAFAFRISNGKQAVKCINTPERAATLFKLALRKGELPQNFINPIIGENLLPLETQSLETAKELLRNEILTYLGYHAANPTAKPIHPVFGALTKNEWDQFHKMHITHHFKQFGL